MSDSQVKCFWCQQDVPKQTLFFVDGISLCENHAKCRHCGKIIKKDAQACICPKFGYGEHEDALWCSISCMDEGHPIGDEEYHYDLEEEAT